LTFEGEGAKFKVKEEFSGDFKEDVLDFSHEINTFKILFLEFIEHLVGDLDDFGDSVLNVIVAVKRVGELSVGFPGRSINKEGTISKDHLGNSTSSRSLDVRLFLVHEELLDKFRVF